MENTRVLFVTACPTAEQAEWTQKMESYLQPLLGELRHLGAVVELRSFQDKALDAEAVAGYTHVLFLAADKYNLHVKAFHHFLSFTLPTACTLNPALRIWNSETLVEWNCDKRYLLEVARAGFKTPRTVFVEPSRLSGTALEELRLYLRETFPDRPLVVKASISASGLHTYLLRTPHAIDESDVQHLQDLHDSVQSGSIMLQEFLPDIQAESGGEWSMVYIAGELTHIAVKRPKEGEWRINGAYGGRTVVLDRHDPTIPASAVSASRGIWEWLNSLEISKNPWDGSAGLLYARIDGVVNSAGDFILMEIELVEPYLWLDREGPDQAGLHRLCNALAISK